MTLVPGPRNVSAEVRGAARRQAQQWSGAGPLIAGMAITAFLMVVFVTLDYKFDQDPHRIVKVGLGVLALGAIFAQPRFGLLLLPVVTPFLTWVPPLPIPGLNALNVLLLEVFGSFALAQVMARQPFLRSGRLGPALFILLGIAAVSIIRGALFPTGYAYVPIAALLDLLRSVVTFGVYFIVIAMGRGESDRRRITWAVLLGLLLESIAVIKLGRNGSAGRATGSIGQPNELGAFLGMFSMIALALMVGARSWYARLCAAAVFGMGAFAILLSLSRGSMLALVGGATVVLWRSSKIALAIMLVVLVASPFWLPDYVKDRISNSTTETEEGVSADKSSEARLLTWRAIFGVISQHPVDGVGFDGLGAVLPDMGETLGLADVRESAHNTFLRMLGELGIFGFAAFLFVLWKVFRLGDEAARRATRRFDRAAATGLCGALVVISISCFFGDRFWSPVVVSSLWVMAGVVEDSLNHPAPEATA
jgi:O-antigen ligase